MVNLQHLTLWLTKTFSQITPPFAIQNTFALSFLNYFSQRNKLDAKNQKENPTEMEFPTVTRKVRKKRLFRYSFILSINGQPLL